MGFYAVMIACLQTGFLEDAACGVPVECIAELLVGYRKDGDSVLFSIQKLTSKKLEAGT
jgi:hypothetical protein